MKPFGPAIAKVEMSPDLVKVLNNYTDEEIKKSKEKTEFTLDDKIIKKLNWAEYIGTLANSWVENETKKPLKKISIAKTWTSRQFKNQFNPIHFYKDGNISGIAFLKVPKSFDSSEGSEEGKLTLIHGSISTLCNSIFSINPKVGDFYLFPSYLMNLTYPFTDSDEELRTIKFSAKIDGENIIGI